MVMRAGKAGAGGAAPRGLRVRTFSTPLGEMRACADEDGLYFLRYADAPAQCANGLAVCAGENAARGGDADALLSRLGAELDAYFAGAACDFDFKLHLRGRSAFSQAAWLALRSVPRGETRSYAEQAAFLGKSRGFSRAVAAANSRNPFALLLPCHRIIAAGGKLAGYNGGLWRKAFLLRLEGARLPL